MLIKPSATFLFVVLLVVTPVLLQAAMVHDFDCVLCHQDYSSAEKPLMTYNACLTCHNPGKKNDTLTRTDGTPTNPITATFVISDASNAFGTNAGAIGETSHAFAGGSDSLPTAGASPPQNFRFNLGWSNGQVTCGRCHNPHSDTSNPKLLKLGAGSADAMCLECHQAWDTQDNHGKGTHPLVADYAAVASVKADSYNAAPDNFGTAAGIGLVDSGKVSCTSCHGVHFADSSATTPDSKSATLVAGDGKLLKSDGSANENPDQSLCQGCHTYTKHGRDNGNPIGCLSCHSGHNYDAGNNANYYVLRKQLTLVTPKTGSEQTVTLDYTNYPPPANFNGICEQCHILPASHDAGSDCNSCHGHSNGFGHGGSGGCHACHGHDAGYEYETGLFSQGAGTTTSHSRHTEDDADDNGGPFISCARCHDTDAIPAFASGTDGDGNGKYSLAETDVCDACHQDATGLATGSAILVAAPEWNVGTVACGDCHGPEPAYADDAPKANSHSAHSLYSCGTCHAATTIDGSAITDQSVHTDGAYTLQAATDRTLEYAFDAAGGTCSNISCHGTNSATWGTGPMQCDSCHGYPPVPGDGNDINEKRDGGKGVHATTQWEYGVEKAGAGHVDQAFLDPANDVYGDIWTGFGQCAKCHYGATHFNDTIEVSIANEPVPDPLALSYDGLNPPVYEGTPGSFDTPKTCFNTRCHLQRSPRWSCPGDE